MAKIEIKNVSKDFENNNGTILHAVKNVSLTVNDGEVVVIIGPSGSGKSTLLRIVNGLETAQSGSILIDGVDIMDKDTDIRRVREEVGMVFQSFNLFPQYTALQNVTLARELMAKDTGESRDAIRAAGMELLAEMGLADRAEHYPHQLSGGQQQRVAIARALALHPDILCFDEPTSALDPELTGEVLKVIRGLAEQKTTMIIVTHEMAFARDVADQVIFMDGGFIVEQGDPRQVIDHPREERTKQFLSRFTENS